MAHTFFTIVHTDIADHHIVWREDETGIATIEKILIVPQAHAMHQSTQRHSANERPTAVNDIVDIIHGHGTAAQQKNALAHCDFTGSTPWQHTVWLHLAHNVPRGETRSYGALAAELGRPKAARSIGSCMAHNRFPLLIPCHRIIAANGQLGGFMKNCTAGSALKTKLLAQEGVYV